jgi:hypothetical protein
MYHSDHPPTPLLQHQSVLIQHPLHNRLFVNLVLLLLLPNQ